MHKGSVAVNITRRAADATDNRNFSAAECQLREDIFTFTRILKENFAEFADCYVSSTAPQAGVRESRRICGVHTVTADEYVNAYRYEDSISRGIHPIDIHASKGTHQTRIDLDKPAYVPYRALIAPNYPNLLVAGRCLSADRQALASLRVMASCMGTGQAAGRRRRAERREPPPRTGDRYGQTRFDPERSGCGSLTRPTKPVADKQRGGHRSAPAVSVLRRRMRRKKHRARNIACRPPFYQFKPFQCRYLCGRTSNR